MDCEKFETTMIDELYEELDELTSAAAKRHVAGCARCAALLGGLRATRRVVVQSLATVEPPADLEERILAAARDAQKVVPIQRRVSRVVSWAGNWAMKPQTAMAAVFLLMIGSSVFLLRGKHATSASAPMTVTEQGAPAASVLAKSDEESLDTPGAAAAHGTTQDYRARAAAPSVQAADPATVATAAATTTAAAALAQNTPADGEKNKAGLLDRLSGGAGRRDKPSALGQALADDEDDGTVARGMGAPSNAGAIGGAGGMPAPVAAASPAPPPAMKRSRPSGPADMGPVAAPAANAQQHASGGDLTATSKKGDSAEGKDSSGPTFGSAKAAFDASNFTEATRQFDLLANGGDLNAALWAARSVRSASGCPAAAARFDQVAQKATASTIGNDARLEAGKCYRQMGSFERARAELVPLLIVRSHADRAQQELNAMPSGATAKPSPRKAPEQQSPYQSPPQTTPNSAGF